MGVILRGPAEISGSAEVQRVKAECPPSYSAMCIYLCIVPLWQTKNLSISRRILSLYWLADIIVGINYLDSWLGGLSCKFFFNFSWVDEKTSFQTEKVYHKTTAKPAPTQPNSTKFSMHPFSTQLVCDIKQ